MTCFIVITTRPSIAAGRVACSTTSTITRRRSGSGRRPSGAAPAGASTSARRPPRARSGCPPAGGCASTFESSITTECSISLWTTSQPLPMALNGPMKLSTIRVSRPIATGPRIVELTISAPSATTTRPSSDDAASTDAVDPRLDLLEQQPVGLEQRRQLAGVDPPAGEQLGAHPLAVGDQPLDGVGDLQLAAGRRRDRPHRVVDRLVEQVHADEGEVRRRVVGLLDELDDVAVLVERGDAEAVRIGHLLEQDLGGRRVGGPPGRLEGGDERRRGPAPAGCRRGTSRSRRRRGSRRRSARSGPARAARPAGCR